MVSFGQSITWGPANPAGSASALEVYNGSSSASFQFTNDAVGLNNMMLNVDLGVGVVYEAGGFSYTTSGSGVITEVSASGASPAVFSIDTLAPGEVVTIEFLRKAECEARDHKIAGNTFEDVLRLFSNGSEVNYSNNSGNPYAAEYDVIYGNVIIGAISHTPSQLVGVGESTTRCFNVTNGSFGGLNEFWVSDSFAIGEIALSDFQINGNPIPAANITSGPGGVRIHFDDSLIPFIDGTGGTSGDSDLIFEKDEFFQLCYEVTPLGCNVSNSLPSQIHGYYGEDENTECAPSGMSSTSVSIANGVPQISVSITRNPTPEICQTVRQCVTLTNSAVDPEDFAMDLNAIHGVGANTTPIATPSANTLRTSTYRQWSNFTINDSMVVLDMVPSGNANTPYIAFDFYTTDVDGPGGLEDLDMDGFYDDLAGGSYIEVCFDLMLDPLDIACGVGRRPGIEWEHHYFDVNHKNQCGEDRTPLRRDLHYGSLLREYIVPTTFAGPSDVNDQDTFQVWVRPYFRNLGSRINCEGISATNSTNPNVEFTVALELPPGVSLYNNNASLPASYNPVITANAAGDSVFYTINRTNVAGNQFDFNLQFDCAEWDNMSPLMIPFQTTYKCSDCYEDDIHCGMIEIIPHCPGCDFGISTKSFEPRRITAGYTDNTRTAMVDLTDGTHALDWLLPFDTFEICTPGVIGGDDTDNVHFRLEYTPESGNDVIEFVGGEVTIYDLDGAYGSNYHTFPITVTPVVNNLGGGTYEALFDLSAYLAMVDPDYELGEGSGGAGTYDRDSLNLKLQFLLKNNFPEQNIQDIMMRGTHFYYDDMGDEISCDSYGGIMYHEYPGIRFGATDQVIARGCQDITVQPLWAIGSATSDPFPNEYRPVYQIDSVVYQIPDEFEFNGTVTTAGINGSFSYYYNAAGDLVVYPNPDYVIDDTRGTNYPRPQVFVNANCLVENGENYFFPSTGYWTEYLYADTVNHQVNSTYAPSSQLKTYVAPTFTLTPLNQIVQGTSDTVFWDVQACNTSASLGVDYSWLNINDMAAGLTIISVVDISTGAELPITTSDFGGGNTLVELGDLQGATCKTIRIYTLYESCTNEFLDVDFGWSCAKYPLDIDEAQICMETVRIEVNALDATVSATITPIQNTPIDPLDPDTGNYGSTEINMCEEFPVEVRFISADAASIYDINFRALIPNAGDGLTYIPGSGTIEVEGVDGLNMPRVWDIGADTVFANASDAGTNNFRIYLEDIDSTNFKDQGLLGAGQDPMMNEFILRWKMKSTCDLTSGRPLRLRVFANELCGERAGGYGEVVRSSNYKLTGATLPYNTSISTTFTPDGEFTNCNQSKNVELDILLSGGTTGTEDSLYVILPEGVVFDGNFNCNSTDCPIYEGTRTELGSEVIVFSYPSGLTNATFNIDFDIESNLDMLCGDQELELSSVALIAGLMCGMDSTCTNTEVITGSIFENLSIDKPSPSVTNYRAILCPDSSYVNIQEGELTISNQDLTAGDSLKIIFYCADPFGFPSGNALDSVLFTGPIAAGGTVPFNAGFDFSNCNLNDGIVGVVSDEFYCVCDSLYFTMDVFEFTPAVVAAISDTIICQGDTIQLAATGKANSIYNWSPNTDMTCSNCPMTNAYPLTSTEYVVEEIDSLGCSTMDTVFVEVMECDWGDLPDPNAMTATNNYQTTKANNGPHHYIIPGLSLGTSIDGELDGQPSGNALGDGADENGLFIFPTLNLTPGGTFELPLSTINTTTDTAFVALWIDWNGDGDFSDANESVFAGDDETGLPSMLTITIPPTAVQSQLVGVRIRISHENDLTPYGRSTSGEIEDYLIGIECEQVCLPLNID